MRAGRSLAEDDPFSGGVQTPRRAAIRGRDDVLEAYQRQRRFDQHGAMEGATDTLNRLFSNDIRPVRIMCRVAAAFCQTVFS